MLKPRNHRNENQDMRTFDNGQKIACKPQGKSCVLEWIPTREGDSRRIEPAPCVKFRNLLMKGILASSSTYSALDVLEIFPKAVDGVANSSGLSFSVDEHDAVDQVL